MSGTIMVRGARQLLTLHGTGEPRCGPALGQLAIIRDGALLIEDGRIIEVGPSRRIESLARSRRSQEIDASGRVVIPGFVDCHTQLVGGASRPEPGPEPPAAASSADAHSPVSPGDFVRTAPAGRLESRARQFVNGMVRHGTTILESSCGFGLDQRSELKALRVQTRLDRAPVDVVSTYSIPPSLPEEYDKDPAKYLVWLCNEMLPAVGRKSRARFAGLRCSADVFDPAQSRRYLECARSLGFRVKVQACGCAGNWPVHLSLEVGAHSVNVGSGVSAADVESLAKSQTMAVLLPASTFGCANGSGIPARQLIDGGAAVALGSNFNPGARPAYSMQAVIALACEHLGMTAAEAICASTHNAACAIGSAGVAGSLEVGKPADFIMLNTSDYREIPQHFGVNLVHCTVKHGEIIYYEGKVALR